MWDRWQRGESLKAISRILERPSSSIFGQLTPTGAIRTPVQRRSRIALTLSEREEIPRGIASQQSLRTIAKRLGRAPSTISRKIHCNLGYDNYRATQANQAAWDKAHRPKLCKLSLNPTQRGSNENTNRLLIQYLPSGTDISVHSQAKLN